MGKTFSPEAFLEEVYHLTSTGQEVAAMDMIYEEMFDLAMVRGWPLMDETVALADPSRLAPTGMLSLLTVTAPAKSLLPHRATFYRDCRDNLLIRRGERATKRMLIGLK